MIYIPICITLLVLLASLHFLAKFKKEGLGGIFIWGSYLIMLAATLILLCQLARGVVMMRHHFRQPAGMGCCDGGSMKCDGMRGGMTWHHDGCCMDKGCCDGGGMMKCDGGSMKCDGMMKCDGDKMMCDKDKMKDGKDSTAACCKGKKEMKEKPEKPEQPEKK
jgi:hypothetical protein